MITITPDGQMIVLISAAISVTSILVRRAVLDMDKMREMKEQMKEHQKSIKEATKSGDKKRAQKAQDDLMKLTMENMKHSFKPMIFTFIPFIIVFGWMRGEFSEVGQVANLFGYGLDWFGWYFVCAMVISMVLNKAFKLM